MVTKQKPLTKGGFCLFIVRFEIESNFENRLNLRGLKMKTVSINVYSYDELSKPAQEKAESDWLDSDPAYSMFDEWRNFIAKLKDLGIEVDSWEFDYGTHHVWFNQSSDLIWYRMTPITILKKLLYFYHELAFCPKVYWLNGKKRISKIQKIEDESLDWITNAFVYGLKESIQQKEYRRSLEYCLESAIEHAAKPLQEEYEYVLSSFPLEAKENNYYFYDDGRRFYAESEV